MFDKVLIANRGEIACRIIATCRRLGIASVAIYSEADAGTRHVRLAEQGICVGVARDSYLRMQIIIDAARRSGAQAIHPGYGFLSENPQFAEECGTAGLTFVGPPAAAMRAMSSKANAKQLMQRSAVPVLPGYHGEDQDAAHLRREAERIGYPVLIKATNGGGGKGMRVVEHAAEFEQCLLACQREAQLSFGDARVLLEKYLQHTRHIEVQIFGDSRGQMVHLYERDCSAQRRHQKVLEEAPALAISAAQRAALTRAACDAARAVGYIGAGTVEFLLDTAGAFYFMEMNTRIQVEHPVTEMITGVDLVEWQLRVAAGEPLPLVQAQIAVRGHAIEARLYAEVPELGFLPSSGTLRRFDMPASSPRLRLESAVEAGDTVGIDYDPLLAKLIVHADTRSEAIAALQLALSQVRIAGVGNNVMFLRRLVGNEVFRAGGVDTGFIEREREDLSAPCIELASLTAAQALASAALWVLAQERSAPQPPAHSAWNGNDGWRLNACLIRTIEFSVAALPTALPVTVVLEYRPAGLHLAVGEYSGGASLRAEGADLFVLQLAANTVRTQIDEDAGQLRVLIGSCEYRLRRVDAAQRTADSKPSEARLVAPMPGRIISLLVAEGATVQRGSALLVLEAMKMEHTICAPADGRLRAYRVAVGAQVKEGAELLEFEAQI